MLDFKPEAMRAAVDEASKHIIPKGKVLLEEFLADLLDGADELLSGREITIKITIGEKQKHEN